MSSSNDPRAALSETVEPAKEDSPPASSQDGDIVEVEEFESDDEASISGSLIEEILDDAEDNPYYLQGE